MTDTWQSTEEYKQVLISISQGRIAEWSEFSSIDNPYKYMTMEWINWNYGYFKELDKHMSKMGIV